MLKSRRSWLLLAAVLVAALSLWMAARVRSSSWYIAETNYAQIKEGMDYEEVTAIMGRPPNVSFGRFSFGQDTCVWLVGDLPDGYSIMGTFDVKPTSPWPLVSKSIGRPDTLWERVRTWLAFGRV